MSLTIGVMCKFSAGSMGVMWSELETLQIHLNYVILTVFIVLDLQFMTDVDLWG